MHNMHENKKKITFLLYASCYTIYSMNWTGHIYENKMNNNEETYFHIKNHSKQECLCN